MSENTNPCPPKPKPIPVDPDIVYHLYEGIHTVLDGCTLKEGIVALTMCLNALIEQTKDDILLDQVIAILRQLNQRSKN